MYGERQCQSKKNFFLFSISFIFLKEILSKKIVVCAALQARGRLTHCVCVCVWVEYMSGMAFACHCRRHRSWSDPMEIGKKIRYTSFFSQWEANEWMKKNRFFSTLAQLLSFFSSSLIHCVCIWERERGKYVDHLRSLYIHVCVCLRFLAKFGLNGETILYNKIFFFFFGAHHLV